MSRGRHDNRCYVIDHAAERDPEGVHHPPWEERTVAERITAAWNREENKDSTLDYPQRYRSELSA